MRLTTRECVCVLVDVQERLYPHMHGMDALRDSLLVLLRDVALGRLRSEGAHLTTVESLLFELTRFAGTDTFRAISRLVR